MDQIWHDSHETLLETMCDEAQIRSILHLKQAAYYKRRNQMYTLPIVVLSVLSGSGNFISEGYQDLVKKYLIFGIGLVSILTSIISAISHHLGLAQLMEGNRIAGLSWGKFYSRLKFQLSLVREERENIHDFLNSVFSEYDRLSEISPLLLKHFIRNVKSKLNSRILDDGFVLPYYMNGFAHCKRYDEGYEADDEKA